MSPGRHWVLRRAARRCACASLRRPGRDRMIVVVLLACLVAIAGVYLVALARAWRSRRGRPPSAEAVALGGVTNFFDTLGIGSFAPSTAWIKLRGLTADGAI